MKNYRIYLYITLGFTLFFFIITVFATPYFVRSTVISSLENEIAAGKQEASQIAIISGELLAKNISKDDATRSIQKAIINTENENIFLSLIDWSGKIVSYPDVTKIGVINNGSSNGITTMDNMISGEELYHYITSKDLNQANKMGSDIIFMQSIPNSDLIVSAHINEKNVNNTINKQRLLFNISFLIIGLLTLVFTLAITRYLSSRYEELLNQKATKIEDSFLNLSKLNTSLENYQNSLLELKQTQERQSQTKSKESSNSAQERSKQRLLTYVRNELVSVSKDDIAYIYVDRAIIL